MGIRTRGTLMHTRRHRTRRAVLESREVSAGAEDARRTCHWNIPTFAYVVVVVSPVEQTSTQRQHYIMTAHRLVDDDVMASCVCPLSLSLSTSTALFLMDGDDNVNV